MGDGGWGMERQVILSSTLGVSHTYQRLHWRPLVVGLLNQIEHLSGKLPLLSPPFPSPLLVQFFALIIYEVLV